MTKMIYNFIDCCEVLMVLYSVNHWLWEKDDAYRNVEPTQYCDFFQNTFAILMIHD